MNRMRAFLFRSLLAATVAIVANVAPLAAQVGSTTDIITGRVTAPDGRPIENANVTAQSAETRVSRSRITNKDGRYTILFPDGGGQYRITVRAIGVAPQAVTLTRQGDEDRLVHDFKMTVNAAPQSLAAVNVRATRPQAPQERPTPGSSERNFTPEQMARLPVDANDLNTLAALAPGVIGVGGTDSTSASFAVAGQRTTQNNLTLDGISFGSSSVPQEAVRSTRVITSTYDVARGQFTGGQIASTTRGGTNILQGSGTFNWRDPSLQWTPAVQGAYGQGYNQDTFSAGLGGPIIEDKLFYFGAVQFRSTLSPLQALSNADSLSLVRLGLSPDSVSTFVNRANVLFPGGLPFSGLTDRRTNNNLTGIVRVDWNITDEHTLTLRGDYRTTEQERNRIGSYSTPDHGGNSSSTGGGLQGTLTSHFGSSFVHEFKGYYSKDNRTADPFVEYPEARVRLTSTLPDGTSSVSSLSFGANPGLPNDGSGKAFEGTDELSWISPNGEHRVKLGVLYNWQQYDQQVGINSFGSYTFNTLADFLANTPVQFSRTTGLREAQGEAANAAVYLGDIWRLSRSLQVTYGLRAEGSRYAGAPAYNAAIDNEYRLRTDIFPGETHMSPRVGFTYTMYGNADSPAPTWTFRGGIGEFRGRVPTGLFTAAQQGSGVPGSVRQVICLGSGVPSPIDGSGNWSTTIPTQCNPGSPALTTQSPSVTAFANDFEAPRSWRTSLNISRRFLERWNLSVDWSYAIGQSLYGVRDRNLVTAPQFTLANEGDRPVFVQPATISPVTGIAPLQASRVDPTFAQVYELGSNIESRTNQVTLALQGFSSGGMLMNLAYTYQRSRDQSSWSFGPPAFGFSGPTTSGNPNITEWAPSDLERQHNVVATITYPLNPSLELTFIGRLQSGGHFTPLVGSDINGDGARNDRAFVFNPTTTTDTAVANGMNRLLATTSGEARSCLLSQLGRIVGRNSCDEPWYPSLDMQVNYKPDRFGLARRLALSLTFVNPLAGLDQAINGENHLQGWGQPSRPDQTLLYVKGFDANTNTYKYQVNGRFGNTIGSAQAFRQPFLLQLQARFSYGQQTGFGAFAGGGAGGRPGGGGGGLGALAARVPNPLAQILEMKDSLKLTDDQVIRLQVMSDTLAAVNTRLGEDVRATVAKAGNNPDMAVVFASIRPKLDEARKNLTGALKQAESVLTPDQWKLVPERIRNPFAAFQNPDQQRRGNQRP